MSELGKRKDREYDGVHDDHDDDENNRELDQDDDVVEDDVSHNDDDDGDDDDDYCDCDDDDVTDTSSDSIDDDEEDDSSVSWCRAEEYYSSEYYRKHEVDNDNSLHTDHNVDDGRDNPLFQAFSRMESDNYCLYLMKMYPNAAQLMDQNKNYPLHHACYRNLADIIILKLMEVFPDAVRQKNCNGHYPLHIASSRGCSEHIITKLIQIFPEAVGMISRVLKRHRIVGQTEYIATLEYPSTMEARERSFGYTPVPPNEYLLCYPIHIAILCRQSLNVIEGIMHEDPLGMERVDEDRRTPLHSACSVGNNKDESVVLRLMQCHNIQINAKTRCGNTPLHDACWRGSIAIVRILVAHPDINVNATTKLGLSALHYAVKYPYHKTVLAMVQALLHHPCIIADLKDVDDKTPLDILNSKKDLPANNDDVMVPYLAIKTLLEEFPIKRRWGAFEHLLGQVEIW